MTKIDVDKLTRQHDQMLGNIKALASALDEAQRQASTEPFLEQYNTEIYRRRLASTGQLEAVVQYLEAIGLTLERCAPLLELLTALIDAGQGIRSPILVPEKPGTGSRTGLEDILVRSRASAAVTVLVEGGQPLSDALRPLARASGTTITELKNWRTETLRDRKAGKRSSRVERYEADLAMLHKLRLRGPELESRVVRFLKRALAGKTAARAASKKTRVS